MEPTALHESVAAQRFARFTSPVDLQIHSRRYRLADPDGISAKACIDALVHCKILEDDSCAWIKEVRFTQEQINKDQSEETFIIIRRAAT